MHKKVISGSIPARAGISFFKRVCVCVGGGGCPSQFCLMRLRR